MYAMHINDVKGDIKILWLMKNRFSIGEKYPSLVNHNIL